MNILILGAGQVGSTAAYHLAREEANEAADAVMWYIRRQINLVAPPDYMDSRHATYRVLGQLAAGMSPEESMDTLREARVLIVVAGMEGALPSVVGGVVDKPVIAVPTSIGYGASFGGVTALLGMLNSCASNVVVVNIDNGFGAAHVATLINRL